MAHFASSSAGLSFRTAISTTAGADQVLAVYNDRLAEADFVMLAASGTRSARPRCSCFRARLRGHRARISCPKYQPSSGQLCMPSKHAEIVSKQAEIVLKRADNTRKQLTGW